MRLTGELRLMGELREDSRARRFALAMPTAFVSTLGSLPIINLSWVFLRGLQYAMSPTEWRDYLAGEDEVRIGDDGLGIREYEAEADD